MEMVEGPKGGTLEINGTNGTAMVDKFLISANDWISYDFSSEFLEYQYFFTNLEGELIQISEKHSNMSSFVTYLPPTSRISVIISDNIGGFKMVSLEVDVQADKAIVRSSP